MLSILIPVYNYNVLQLVEEIHQQATACHCVFEIIVIDDASEKILFDAQKINTFSNTKLILLKQNIGRSAIRNALANKASFSHLLFIDAGTFPKSKTYISEYLNQLDKDVVIGGMVNETIEPKRPYKLRWLYTKTREAVFNKHVLTSANFMIKKSIILSYPFDETITTYGYEDFIFFKNLEANTIAIHFINNPVIHDGMDDANSFLKKTEDGLNNLAVLLKTKKHLLKDNSVITYYSKLKSFGLSWFVSSVFKITKPILVKNFNSDNPSIILFDFYKLGYFCSIKNNA